MQFPREIRDCVYTHIITNFETDCWNDCGIALVKEEFIEAIIRETRVGVDGYLDKETLMPIFSSVRTKVREQALLLAIDVAGAPNIASHITDIRKQIADGLINVAKSFPAVYDISFSIRQEEVADEKLRQILQHEVETLPKVKTYRIYTHKKPGWRSRLASEDSRCGLSTSTWMEYITDGGEKMWKPRVFADGQWSTENPVCLTYVIRQFIEEGKILQ
jgi:hypothetical protein